MNTPSAELHQETLTRAEQIAGWFRDDALAVTAELHPPTHHETVWGDVCGAVAFALSIRNPDWSGYQVRCAAELLMMHLEIDQTPRALATTRDLDCAPCAEVTS